MTDLYVIQCDDDPYCAPYADSICKSLDDAIKVAQTTEDFRYIELYTGNDNCIKSSRRYFNAQGQEINYKGDIISGNNQQSDNINDFDDEINEALRLAGVQLNEDWFSEHQSKNASTVKDLIEKLQQCNPNATVIVSEKPGRGGASCYVYQGYTDKNGFYLSKEQNEEYSIPAIEITCDF